jgi:hypothetical protein
MIESVCVGEMKNVSAQAKSDVEGDVVPPPLGRTTCIVETRETHVVA